MIRKTLLRGAWIAPLGLALLVTASACKPDARREETATGTVATGLQVREIDLGKRIGADKRVTEEADDFAPTETIYASVSTTGTGSSAVLQARWTYQDGQLVDESSQTISPSGPAVTEFHVSKPSGFPKGDYKVEIFLNGSSVGTKEFEVK